MRLIRVFQEIVYPQLSTPSGLPIYLLTRETYITRICFDRYAIVSDMSAAGLGLNKFCYAGLITAFKNKTPTTEETMAKVWYACVRL